MAQFARSRTWIAVLTLLSVSAAALGYTLSQDPKITDFAGSLEGSTWTFDGCVDDEDPISVDIDFGGVLAGESTTVDAQGGFELEIMGVPDGTATAQAEDFEGNLSNVAEFEVSNP